MYEEIERIGDTLRKGGQLSKGNKLKLFLQESHDTDGMVQRSQSKFRGKWDNRGRNKK